MVDYFDGDTYVEKLRQALASAGANGWELAAIISSGSDLTTRPNLLVFKRLL